MDASPLPSPHRHRWPWFLLAALVLGVVLAVLGMYAEVRRTQERRQDFMPRSETNAAAPAR